MAKIIGSGRYGLAALALGVGCLMIPPPTAGQAFPRVPKRVVLDAKQVLKLVLKREKPVYPPLARLNYIQGPVQVQVLVTREGRVSEAHVVEGHAFLAAAALEAVRRWLFHPARSRSGPAEFAAVLNVNFRLQARKLQEIPTQPEKDLGRQIRPPEVIAKTAGSLAAPSVRLRVLVGPEGHAIDAIPLAGPVARYAEAQEAVEHWRFRPARWGTLAVPWYLDVDVPVRDWSTARRALDSTDR